MKNAHSAKLGRRAVSLGLAVVMAAGIPLSAFADTWYIDDGNITITADGNETEGVSGQTVSQTTSSGTNTKNDVSPVITQHDSTTQTNHGITVTGSGDAEFTLDGVNLGGGSDAKITIDEDNDDNTDDSNDEPDNNSVDVTIIVSGDNTVNGQITIDNDTDLVIKDDTSNTTDESDTLTVDNDWNYNGNKQSAAIGTKDNENLDGSITITGNVNVNAYSGDDAAAIGTGKNGNLSGSITINTSGTVDAKSDGNGYGGTTSRTYLGGNGNNGTIGSGSGAAIGTGKGGNISSTGSINISSGTVNATGGSDNSDTGAAIGTGEGGSISGSVNISGGTVSGTTAGTGAGIGTGKEGDIESGGSVNITGGTVTGTTTISSEGGAGIGTGQGGDIKDGGSVNISGDADTKVTGKAGAGGAGIGTGTSGSVASGGSVNINKTGSTADDNSATVSGTSNNNGAGIGSGNGGAVEGSVNISGSGTVTGESKGGNGSTSNGYKSYSQGGAGIGTGNNGDLTGEININVTGGSVTGTASNAYGKGAGIGTGSNGTIKSGSKINITASGSGTTVTGKSSNGKTGTEEDGGAGAGIGSGAGTDNGSGKTNEAEYVAGKINITSNDGATVEGVNDGDEGAGIGGGAYIGIASSGSINLSGNSLIKAEGGRWSAGIGTGDARNNESATLNGTISIDLSEGGTVEAYSGSVAEVEGEQAASSHPEGAAIGTGQGGDIGATGKIEIKGNGTVKAESYEGAGIGTGADGAMLEGSAIEISGGTVRAISMGGVVNKTNVGGAGIGTGTGQSLSSKGSVDNVMSGKITISSATVTAMGTHGAADIGAGDRGIFKGIIEVLEGANVYLVEDDATDTTGSAASRMGSGRDANGNIQADDSSAQYKIACVAKIYNSKVTSINGSDYTYDNEPFTTTNYRSYLLSLMSDDAVAKQVEAEHTPADTYSSDGTNHWYTCKGCGEIITSTITAHTPAAEWISDGNGNHYHVCSVCGHKIDSTVEKCSGTDDGDCTTAVKCSKCSYEIKAAMEHKLEYTVDTHNATEHWQKCTNEGCTYATAHTSHDTLTPQYNETQHWQKCETCGYETEKQNHTYAEGQYLYDGAQHWQKCTACEHMTAKVSHTESTEYSHSDTDHWKTCTVCGQKITATKAAHGTLKTEYNTTQHWQKCETCGYETVKENHIFGNWVDNGNGTHTRTCACGYSETKECTSADSKYYDAKDGTHYQICKDCGAHFNIANHSSTGKYIDAGNGTHYQECDICGAHINIAEHSTWNDWAQTATSHKHTCSVCGYTTTEEAHDWDYPNWHDAGDGINHTRTCKTCGYTETEAHKSATTECFDNGDGRHYQICATCDAKFGHTPHTPMADDGNCTTEVRCTACPAVTYQKKEQHSLTSWKTSTTEHWKECTNTLADGSTCTHIDENGAHQFKLMSDENHHWQQCTVCGYIKDIEDHTASGWQNDSADGHYKKCTVCGQVVEKVTAHSFVQKYNDTDHWQECEVCGYKKDIAKHGLTDWLANGAGGHYKNCESCGYTTINSLVPHNYAQTYVKDEDSHWYVCTDCGYKYGVGAHHFVDKYSEADNKHYQECEECGLIKDADHDYKTEWSSDANGHWHECKNCGYRKDEHEHTFETVYSSDGTYHWYKCTECGYEGSKATHEWTEKYLTDANKHWHKCEICGLVKDDGTHTCTTGKYVDDGDNGHYQLCDICGAHINAESKHSYDEWETVTAATCYSEGLKQRKCTKCGHTETGIIPEIVSTDPKDHSDVVTITVPADCEHEGYSYKYCKACETELGTDLYITQRTEHTYNEAPSIVKPATYTTTGQKVWHCTLYPNLASHDKIEVIPKLERSSGGGGSGGGSVVTPTISPSTDPEETEEPEPTEEPEQTAEPTKQPTPSASPLVTPAASLNPTASPAASAVPATTAPGTTAATTPASPAATAAAEQPIEPANLDTITDLPENYKPYVHETVPEGYEIEDLVDYSQPFEYDETKYYDQTYYVISDEGMPLGVRRGWHQNDGGVWIFDESVPLYVHSFKSGSTAANTSRIAATGDGHLPWGVAAAAAAASLAAISAAYSTYPDKKKKR